MIHRQHLAGGQCEQPGIGSQFLDHAFCRMAVVGACGGAAVAAVECIVQVSPLGKFAAVFYCQVREASACGIQCACRTCFDASAAGGASGGCFME